MQIFMSPDLTARVMARWHWLTLLGFGLLACGFWHPRCLGFASGLMLLMFGSLAGVFRVLLRERGTWMMGALALVAYVPLYGALELECYRLHHNPGQPRLTGLQQI
jgi:hypothetical protein